MRLLVVTLATTENELQACLQAIAAQSFTDYEHLLLQNLPKREAHEKLYATFMQRREEFDLLVKVDADMVIRSPHFFKDVVSRFRSTPALEVLSIGVADYYTDRLVSGLNVYRNTVRWTPTGDRVFTDQFPDLKGRAVMDYTDLAPAASHCADPHPFQAFHFGVHRGLKAHVARQRGWVPDFYARFADIQRTWHHYQRNGDRRLALAVLGGELALNGRFAETQLDYGNSDVESIFTAYAACSTSALEAEIRRTRRRTWGILPTAMRMEVLRGGWATLPLRCAVPLTVRDRLPAIARRLRSWWHR